MTNLLLVGTWFSDGFICDLHRQLLFTSPTVLHCPPFKPKNCNGWLVHAPGVPTNKISSGDEIATPLTSFQIGSIITGFPSGLRRVKHPPQHRPPTATLQLISKNSKISIGGLMLSICWTGQQEPQHNAGWSISSPRPLYAHI